MSYFDLVTLKVQRTEHYTVPECTWLVESGTTHSLMAALTMLMEPRIAMSYSSQCPLLVILNYI